MLTAAALAPVQGRIHLAVANSAVQSTSIARMSIEGSLAASRRTSDTRCWSEDVERKLILIVYLPCEAAEQSAAALANEPEGSGNTYQFSVTGPLPDEPHAATTSAVTAIPKIATMCRTIGSAPLSESRRILTESRRRV